MTVHSFAAYAACQALRPHEFEPAPLGPRDVEIAITHCGICHSDIHLIDNDWGVSQYPLVPGHEIIGTVRALGDQVSHLEIGQRVGVGWQSGSCGHCEWCVGGDDVNCPWEEATCVGRPGGFADSIRINARFAFPIPQALPSETAAPLLCAGITVYTPLSQSVRPPMRVGVVGIGGLGHLALQFAHAFGCEVTAFSTSPDKEAEARRLGAHHFVVSSDPGQMEKSARSVDFLLSTVSGPLDWPVWLSLLRPRGTLCVVGASASPLNIPAGALIGGSKTIRGSAIGSPAVMTEMLQFATRHGITAEVEILPMSEVNQALDRVRANKARYRMVLKA